MREVVWVEALRKPQRPLRWAGPAVIATSALLTAAVVLLRFAVQSPEASILVLLALPVTLLAASFGRTAGLASAALAIVLILDYAATHPGTVGGANGLMARAGLIVSLGYTVGWFAERLRDSRRAEEQALFELRKVRDELYEAERVAGLGSWYWNVTTNEVTLSPHLVELLALESPSIDVEEVIFAHVHPDDVTAQLDARDQLLQGARHYESSLRLLLPDGQVRHVLNRGETVTEDGVLVGARGTTLDITALREAELAARASAERLSNVLENLLDSVTMSTAVRDADGHVVDFTVGYANPAAGKLLDVVPEEVVGRRWSELWPHRMSSPFFAAFVDTIETGEPLVLSSVPNADYHVGVAEMLDLSVARLGDGVVTIARDVTERAQTERSLARAAAHFAAAFDDAPVGMALVRPDGTLSRVNDVLCGIIGCVMSELVGSPFDELVDERDVSACRKHFGSLVEEGPGARSRTELRLRTAAGGSRWVACSLSLLEGDEAYYAVAHIEDIDDRKRDEGKMRYLADHDPLTGLVNRRRFQEELEHLHALHARYGGGGAVVLIDLDNFKHINDTLGHRTGDELLQAISRMLRSRLRDTDVVARLGGDEFAVLLPGADRSRAVEVITSLLAGIRGTEVGAVERRVRSTGSAGVALLDEPGAVGPDDVLANADLAMYAAKDAGRDTLVVYDPHGEHAARSHARFRWLDRIRTALETDRFVLRAQPIQDLATGTITGCELLVRMRDGADLVEPERFLDIAERHGLAVPIDRIVVDHGIDLAASQQRPPGFRWEINLSGDSLGDPSMLALIEAKLHETNLPPDSLVFEITESVAISNMDAARVFAANVRELGCGFALDDFGAGYGSFYYLKHLPFDYLKIDGEFIRQLTTSHIDRVIVASIVASAHPLGKQTIAEYVGDADTLDLLRELGVDHAQGYYVGRPVEATLPLAAPVVGATE